MNDASKLLTSDQRKQTVLPILKKELEKLPSENAFGGTNDEEIKQLENWIAMLEGKKSYDEEMEYFLGKDNWKYSCLCDYLP